MITLNETSLNVLKDRLSSAVETVNTFLITACEKLADVDPDVDDLEPVKLFLEEADIKVTECLDIILEEGNSNPDEETASGIICKTLNTPEEKLDEAFFLAKHAISTYKNAPQVSREFLTGAKSIIDNLLDGISED